MIVLRKIYALYCYLITAIAMVMFLLFIQNLFLPKTVSLPTGNPATVTAILIDISLVLLFGLQHSIMSRNWFKKWLSHLLPSPLERVTYILMSSLTLALIVWLWQPFGNVIWDVRGTMTGYLMWMIVLIGGLIIISSAAAFNGKYFAGWQQIQENTTHIEFQFSMAAMYKYVRHPIYFGTLLAFWFVPLLSHSGLMFNLLMTAYVIVGATLEERNLALTFGDTYRSYQRLVPMLIPFTKFKR